MSDYVIKSSLQKYLGRAISSEEGRRLVIELVFQDIQVLSLAAEPEIRKQLAQLGENATKLSLLIEYLLDQTDDCYTEY